MTAPKEPMTTKVTEALALLERWADYPALLKAVATIKSALEDYEKARPLLDIIKGEKSEQIRLDMQTIEETWAEGESAGTSILRAVLRVKENK